MESSRAPKACTRRVQVAVTNERTNERTKGRTSGEESPRANFHIYIPAFRAPRPLTYGTLVRRAILQRRARVMS